MGQSVKAQGGVAGSDVDPVRQDRIIKAQTQQSRYQGQ
jgi:hypothetical protein